MTIQNLTAQLEAARAVIDTPELAKLQEAHAAAQKQLDWYIEQHQADPTQRVANDRAAAKQRTAHALDAVNKMQNQIRQARLDASRLTRLLGSGEALEAARQSWRDAADAQVAATRAAQDAQDAMVALNDVLAAEQEKATAASLLQRAATLAELGFGDKVDTTAAAAGKLLATAELKIDALEKDAKPAAQSRIDLANSALVDCDLATRAAEQAIIRAHADCAELQFVIDSQAFADVVTRYHATQIAAYGEFGPKANFYSVVNDPKFSDAADEIKASAERGE